MKNKTPLKYLILAFFLIVGNSSFVKAEVDIPSNVKSYNGHLYEMCTDSCNWNEAQSRCVARGGHLVTITSAAEQAFVHSIISEGCMIGLSDTDTEGSMKWVTGEPTSYTNFAVGEPNNERDEDYCLMFLNGFWNDGHLERENWPYVCEWDSVVDFKGESNRSNENQNESATISVSYVDDNKEYKYSCAYSDAFFEKPATEEQPELALLSVLGAATTYTKKGGKGTNYASKMLKQCGFIPDGGYLFSKDGKPSTSKKGYSTRKGKAGNDHCRVQLAVKPIPEDNPEILVVAVFINGYTKDGFEWLSNFNLGTGKNHAGFYAAEKELKKIVDTHTKKYRKVYGANIKIKYWITGHSRAGALTNILALDLGKEYNEEDIFAYGFATPAYSRNKTYKENIKNYIIGEDFVPKVAPATPVKKWGFYRNNPKNDYSIKIDSKSKIGKKARKIYKQIIGKAYGGFTAKQVQGLVDAFQLFAVSQKNYNKNRFYVKGGMSGSPCDFCQNGMALALTEGGMIEGAVTMKLYAGMSLEAKMVVDKLIVDGAITTRFRDAHRMTAYIAAVAAHYGK